MGRRAAGKVANCRVALLVLAVLAFGASASQAQDDSGAERRARYASAFAAQPQGEGNLPRLGQTPQQQAEYARGFQALLDLQERRESVPANPQAIPNYVRAMRAEIQRAVAATHVPAGLTYLLLWNHVALDATAMDHSTLSPAFGEQLGPTRSSRALAITHVAMFEAVNAITRNRASYRNMQAEILRRVNLPAAQITAQTASIDRAIVEAAFRTLEQLYGKKVAILLKPAYDEDRERLGDIPDATGQRPGPMVLGEAIGAAAAAVILEMRKYDRSELADLSATDLESPDPQLWRRDPITRLDLALGGNWGRVKPFVISSGDAFRPGGAKLPNLAFPAFGSPDFIAAYKEVKQLGGDPNAPIGVLRWPTQTTRTGATDPNVPSPPDNTNQTFVGIFWGYDGTALLCAPPRLYNMIATSVALKERPITAVEDMAQYLALVNVAMADAGIAAWDAKFHFVIPRPVSYIRLADADQTPEGKRDERWTPLGAPVTNGTAEARNLTPPFPSYPSGHATFGGALFRAMTLYFKKLDPMFSDDGIAFDFVSDEYNGVNRGPGETQPRQRIVAHFNSFKEAEDLNAQSRIYLGIHWKFDALHGIEQGRAVAEEVFQNFVMPGP